MKITEITKSKKRKIPKPRNEYAYALSVHRSGSGAHGKSNKARRRQDKVDIQRRLDNYSD